MRLAKKTSPLLQVVVLCVIILHIIAFLFFQVSSNHLPDKEPGRPYAKYISPHSLSSDVELEEYTVLFDSAPLFMPTLWNASQSIKVEFSDVTLNQFQQFDPQINILKDLYPRSFPMADNFQVNEPMDLLASRFWHFFTDFGKTETSSILFVETSLLAEVSVLDSSEQQSVQIPVDLDTTVLFSTDRPVVYHIRISEYGLLKGAPMLVRTSGSDAFDQSVAKWMRRPEVSAKLPEGYLEIRVFSW